MIARIRLTIARVLGGLVFMLSLGRVGLDRPAIETGTRMNVTPTIASMSPTPDARTKTGIERRSTR